MSERARETRPEVVLAYYLDDREIIGYTDGLLHRYEDLQSLTAARHIAHIACNPAPHGTYPPGSVQNYLRGVALGLATTVGKPDEEVDGQLAEYMRKLPEALRRENTAWVDDETLRDRLAEYSRVGLEGARNDYRPSIIRASEAMSFGVANANRIWEGFGLIWHATRDKMFYRGVKPGDAARIAEEARHVTGDGRINAAFASLIRQLLDKPEEKNS